MKYLRRLFLVATVLGIFIFGSLFLFITKCYFSQKHFHPVNTALPVEVQKAITEIPDYTRPEVSTYLTFTEWYLVFNPQEYASFISQERPSQFPYFTSIAQAWSGYCEMCGIAQANYSFNAGNHLMISVIATSFAAEYFIKGIWENSLGRLTETLAEGKRTEEEDYAAEVAKAYGDFIPTEPWFAFPFSKCFKELWKSTSLWGPNPIRKWERKLFLSLEYGIKTLYAKLILSASHAVYGIADTEVYATILTPSDSLFNHKSFRKIKTIGNEYTVISLPHYQGFTDLVPLLAHEGLHFIEVAGNNEILVTAIAPNNWEGKLSYGNLLFTQPMAIAKNGKRYLIQAPIQNLSPLILDLEAQHFRIEHLFDY